MRLFYSCAFILLLCACSQETETITFETVTVNKTVALSNDSVPPTCSVNIRLEQAARLLKEQKVNITQVAYVVGFSNLAHFSTVFRKHFGVSPSEYAEREG